MRNPDSSRHPGRRDLRRLAGIAVCGCLVAASVRCTGTTGREGLTLLSGALDGGDDATLDDLDAGEFDVAITYADRALPDVVPPPDDGAVSPSAWPSCPPFI